ncbi:MAG: T9SS type A sorting domain-containing protein [Ignavibacteria bacterium]|jgi:hypothetical protein|nr:T9SS type A sorting domain-containing protein [Ignavibacteria bacterium]
MRTHIIKTLTILLLLLSYPLYSQVTNKAAYIIPDIGAPGMNVYIELIANVDSVGAFGADQMVVLSGPTLYMKPTNAADEWKIQFSPLCVSWNGRLITTQAFIHPNVVATSTDYTPATSIPIALYQNGVEVNRFDFYVVKPFHLGDISGLAESVLGEGQLGRRSPRGAMLVDSIIFGDKRYTISKNDCDPLMEGNQAYLPFTLIATGDIRGGANTEISADATNQDGGVGGGGGGGAFRDENFMSDHWAFNDSRLRAGNGFTGGGCGGINYSSNYSFSIQNGGTGSGSYEKNTQTAWDLSPSGFSINGVAGARKAGYESAGGGTGHPFGQSGVGSADDDRAGGYGGGSGVRQNQPGGKGTYANFNSSSDTTGANGRIHGNRYIVPLAGGSAGASGNPNIVAASNSGYGGGGGGAISISARNINIHSVTANGAKGGNGSDKSNGGNGSGGAIILTAKMGINVDAIYSNDGSDLPDGYARLDGVTNRNVTIYNSFKKAEGVAIDTTSFINRNKTATLRGYSDGDSRLFIKSEHGEWKNYDQVAGSWAEEIPANYWTSSEDTIWYIFTAKVVDDHSSNTYTAIPQFILSQAAAGILKVVDVPIFPVLQLIENLPNNDTLRYCIDTLVEIPLQRICNIGTDRLSFEEGSMTNKLGWITELVTRFTNPSHTPPQYTGNAIYFLEPFDTASVSVKYNIPANVPSGTYYDTIRVMHNDTAKQNPWMMVVKVVIDKRELKYNVNLMELGTILKTAPKQDTSIIIYNNSDITIHISDIVIVSQQVNYDILPKSGDIPSHSSMTVQIKYIPNINAVDGTFIDTIKIVSNCGNETKIPITGLLTESEPIIVPPQGTIPLGVYSDCAMGTHSNTYTAQGKRLTITEIKIYPYGTNPDGSPYVSLVTPVLPYVLERDSTVAWQIEINTTGLTYGIYYFRFDIYHTDNTGQVTIVQNIFSFIVDNPLEASPSIFLFDDDFVGNSGKDSIKLNYRSNYSSEIESAYLAQAGNTVFNLESNLVGHEFHYEGDMVYAVVSYDNLPAAGTYYDTLVVVLHYEYCSNTLRIPITIKVYGKPYYDTLDISRTITLCDSAIFVGNILADDNIVGQYDSILIVRARGADTNMYGCSISQPELPLAIDASKNHPVEFYISTSLATPIGDKNVEYLIEVLRSNGNKTIYTFNLTTTVTEAIRITPTSLDFDTIYIDEHPTQEVAIELLSQRVDMGNYKGSYLIVKTHFGVNPLTTTSSTMPFAVTVEAEDVGMLYDTLVLVWEYPNGCLDSTRIPIQVYVDEKPRYSFTIEADSVLNVSPYKSDVSIPIYITADQDIVDLTLDTLVVNINKTLYYPKSANRGSFASAIDGQLQTITITNIVAPSLVAGTRTWLVNISGDAMLGDAIQSDIDISKVVFNSEILVGNLIRKSGLFSIDICLEGGDRTITYTGAEPALFVLPNPSNGQITVTGAVIEVGKHIIEISDILGNSHTLKEWNATNAGGFEFDFTLPLSDFANGTYSLRMFTPTQVFTTTLIISR